MNTAKVPANKPFARPLLLDICIAGAAMFLIGIYSAYVYRLYVGITAVAAAIVLLLDIPLFSWSFVLLICLGAVLIRIKRLIAGGTSL